MSESPDHNLLFVCTGNTCRSPMAERLMRHLCRGVPGWSFSSAGLFALDGAPASEEAVKVLREKDLDLSDHRSRMLTPEMLEAADRVVPMTRSHRGLIVEAHPAAAEKTRTLHSFRITEPEADVMDPFGGTLDTYRITRDEIESALTDLVLAVIQPPSRNNP